MSEGSLSPPSGPRRWLLVGAGFASLGVGALGVLLPLLPTTPLVLLAAACFARSSPRLHRWLRRHPWFGPSIRTWETQRALPRPAKRSALVLLWVTIPLSMLLLTAVWTRAILGAVLLVATVLVARLPTIDEPSTETSSPPSEPPTPVSRSDP